MILWIDGNSGIPFIKSAYRRVYDSMRPSMVRARMFEPSIVSIRKPGRTLGSLLVLLYGILGVRHE